MLCRYSYMYILENINHPGPKLHTRIIAEIFTCQKVYQIELTVTFVINEEVETLVYEQ